MNSTFQKIEGRTYHSETSFSDHITIRFPSKLLRFKDIDQSNSQIKIRDISHFSCFRARVRGENPILVVSFLQLEEDLPSSILFPNIDSSTNADEKLISANSLITYTMRQLFNEGWIRYEDGKWKEQVPDNLQNLKRRASAVLEKLTTEDRIFIDNGDDKELPMEIDFSKTKLDSKNNLIPIANCGAISDFVYSQTPRLAFNTTFFLLEPEDFFSHHSGLGSGFNLWVGEGVIERPSLYRRATLLGDSEGNWTLDFVGLDDIKIKLPSLIDLSPSSFSTNPDSYTFELNPKTPSPISIYTRYYGVESIGYVIGKTPLSANRFELTIVAHRVCGWKIGGGLDIPQNGFVISFAEDALSQKERLDLLNALGSNIRVTYKFANHKYKTVMEAIQTGPMLVKDGIATIENYDTEKEEEFWASRTLSDGTFQIGAIPTDYDSNVHSRHARVGLGIGKNGEMILVAASGVSKSLGMTDQESKGASLVELAQLLRDAGAQHALNLDGGGSAQVFYKRGRAMIPGERRGEPLLHYDRMVPSVGIVK